MKNITLSADERLIEAARLRALQAKSTLNEQFRLWLEHYAYQGNRLSEYDSTIAELRVRFEMGEKLSRDEMNAR